MADQLELDIKPMFMAQAQVSAHDLNYVDGVRAASRNHPYDSFLQLRCTMVGSSVQQLPTMVLPKMAHKAPSIYTIRAR